MSCIGEMCGDGGYDYAGGGPVHIASGFAGLAYSLVIKTSQRVEVEAVETKAEVKDVEGKVNLKTSVYYDDNEVAQSRVDIFNVFLGTAMMWFGWFGFNGGSSIAATNRGILAALNTTLSASVGGLTWVLLEQR